jgi:hypothetical protein
MVFMNHYHFLDVDLMDGSFYLRHLSSKPQHVSVGSAGSGLIGTGTATGTGTGSSYMHILVCT